MSDTFRNFRVSVLLSWRFGRLKRRQRWLQRQITYRNGGYNVKLLISTVATTATTVATTLELGSDNSAETEELGRKHTDSAKRLRRFAELEPPSFVRKLAPDEDDVSHLTAAYEQTAAPYPLRRGYKRPKLPKIDEGGVDDGMDEFEGIAVDNKFSTLDGESTLDNKFSTLDNKLKPSSLDKPGVSQGNALGNHGDGDWKAVLVKKGAAPPMVMGLQGMRLKMSVVTSAAVFWDRHNGIACGV
jgi:hypothetical protein